MSNVSTVGKSATMVPVQENTTIAVKEEKTTAEQSTSTPKQDPQEKLGAMKMEGQFREAQLRSQLDAPPDWKMPGTEVKGTPIEDPKIEQGFKNFDKPMPSLDMKWPDQGDWKETKGADGAVSREMTDADGTQWKEKINKEGLREREMIAKDGSRKMESSDPSGYTLKGAADKHGNSWTRDSKGVECRSYSGEPEKMFMETKYEDGSRTRLMNDTKGNSWKETIDKDGKIEREKTDAEGNRQFLIKDPSGFSARGFTDTHGNSYTVDSNGTQTRMHQDNGTLYAENSFKDGSRTRQISDQKGNMWTERKEVNGTIHKSKEKI